MINPFEEIKSDILELTAKVDLILLKLGEVDLHEEFNLKGYKAAAKVLGTCISTLQNRIKEGKLRENYHYQKNDTGKYSFSEVALKSDKGLI